jgi:hypothetical protein
VHQHGAAVNSDEKSSKSYMSGGRSGFVSGTPDNLALELLRAIRSDIAELKADIVEVKERLGFLGAPYASISRRVDRMGGDIELIKRRLDLTEAH